MYLTLPQMAAKTKIELGVKFGRSMAELRTCLRQNIQVKIKEHSINITFEMLEVMSCLWQKDGTNQQEIADLTLRDKSSMTYLIDNLVKRQMVRRVEDENDRRNKLIFLTEEGKALKARLDPWVAEFYDTAIGEVEIKALRDGITLLNKMLENIRRG
jgi:DNA-binding MarR family transcriptional regulator